VLIQFDDGRCWDIRFVYNKREDHNGVVDTLCKVSDVEYDSIEDKSTYKVLHEGLAIQNPKDNHVKAIARKVSLANAIAVLPEYDRITIWQQYNEQVKK